MLSPLGLGCAGEQQQTAAAAAVAAAAAGGGGLPGGLQRDEDKIMRAEIKQREEGCNSLSNAAARINKAALLLKAAAAAAARSAS